MVLGVILVAGLAFGGLVLLDRKNDDGASVAEESGADEVAPEVEVDQTEAPEEGDAKESRPGGSDDPSEPVVNPDTNKTQVATMITGVDQVGDVMEVRGMVYSTVDDSGECAIRATAPNGKVQEVTTKVLGNPSSLTCAMVRVPTGGMKGTWKISLNYNSEKVEGLPYDTSFEVR
jgi:hypothetical protein